jgi:hypothetical protein
VHSQLLEEELAVRRGRLGDELILTTQDRDEMLEHIWLLDERGPHLVLICLLVKFNNGGHFVNVQENNLLSLFRLRVVVESEYKVFSTLDVHLQLKLRECICIPSRKLESLPPIVGEANDCNQLVILRQGMAASLQPKDVTTTDDAEDGVNLWQG